MIKKLPENENIYNTSCPILYAMKIIGQKWKLPILWYVADAEDQTLRYKELERKVIGITATMLTKCLRELEKDSLIQRTQYNTIPPVVEYKLTELGQTLIPSLKSLYMTSELGSCFCKFFAFNERFQRPEAVVSMYYLQ